MKLTTAVRVSNILSRARDIVSARWNKNNYVTGPGGEDRSDLNAFLGVPDYDDDNWGYCGDGALRRAIKNAMQQEHEKFNDMKGSQIESLLYDCQKALAGPIERRLAAQNVAPPARRHQAMWCFNDLPSTTQEDILAVYDEAIEEQCRGVVEHAEADERMDRKD